MGKLDGKVVFISGAARGQGRAHAVRFAEEGADVIAIDICGPVPGNVAPPSTEEDLAETVRLVEALDRRIIAEQADVRDLEQLRAAVDHGVGELGRLDAVIANAGIGGSLHRGPSWELAEEQWQVLIDVNLTGVWRTCAVAIPHILAGGRGGSVVLTSSVAGVKGIPNVSHYAAAKHGVLGLMRSLALELAPDSVRVNSILPTNVDTPMIQHERMYRLFRPDLEHPTREDFREAAATINPLPVPWVEAVDIANAAVWLSSDEARYVTGVALPVDAGATTK